MRKVYFTIIIVISIIILTSCAGLGDWSLKLPNNYEMWHINSQNITIGYKQTESSIANSNENGNTIGNRGHVIEFCNNDRFVGAKQVDVPADLKKEIDKTQSRYYLLDTLEQKVYGPFTTEEEFQKKCLELKVSGLNSWEKTSPPPKNAILPELK